MDTLDSKTLWKDFLGFIKDVPMPLKMLFGFWMAVGAILMVIALLFSFLFLAKLARSDTGQGDIYTKTFRYAQRAVYHNIQACGCDMIMVEGSETWKDEENTLLYTAVYEISGGIRLDKSRRVRLEVKYSKSAKSFASTYIDVANPPKIRPNITGVKN